MTSSGKLRLERQYKGDAAHGTVGQEGAGVTETVEFQWFLGVDWGSAAHVLCLVDAQGHVRGRRTVAHTAAAVHDAVQWIGEQTGVTPEAIAIGIETPRGVLVDTALEVGFCVFALNPKQLDRLRDRFTVAGAKEDFALGIPNHERKHTPKVMDTLFAVLLPGAQKILTAGSFVPHRGSMGISGWPAKVNACEESRS